MWVTGLEHVCRHCSSWWAESIARGNILRLAGKKKNGLRTGCMHSNNWPWEFFFFSKTSEFAIGPGQPLSHGKHSSFLPPSCPSCICFLLDNTKWRDLFTESKEEESFSCYVCIPCFEEACEISAYSTLCYLLHILLILESHCCS